MPPPPPLEALEALPVRSDGRLLPAELLRRELPLVALLASVLDAICTRT